MPNFRGRLASNGQTVADGIVGRFQSHKFPNGMMGWSGSFTLPPSVPAIMTGNYELILDDGRSATILVTRLNASSQAPTSVSFRGNGAPP
jgi:hypothetical protein